MNFIFEHWPQSLWASYTLFCIAYEWLREQPPRHRVTGFVVNLFLQPLTVYMLWKGGFFSQIGYPP